MGRCRIVNPDTVRLPLSEGDWIDVKKELNAGEYVALLTAMAERLPFAKILTYVVGWSFVGTSGAALPFDLDMPDAARRATVGSLDKPTLREIITALDHHERDEDVARDAKKKAPDGALASSAPFTSVAP